MKNVKKFYIYLYSISLHGSLKPSFEIKLQTNRYSILPIRCLAIPAYCCGTLYSLLQYVKFVRYPDSTNPPIVTGDWLFALCLEIAFVLWTDQHGQSAFGKADNSRYLCVSRLGYFTRRQCRSSKCGKGDTNKHYLRIAVLSTYWFSATQDQEDKNKVIVSNTFNVLRWKR